MAPPRPLSRLRMVLWCWLPVLALAALAATAQAGRSSPRSPTTGSTSSQPSARARTARQDAAGEATRSSQVGFLESALLGVLPSAMLSRYLSRLRLGGSLNNPDTLMSTEDLIRREGYPVETHIVTTADGYMPMLVRIPHGRRPASRSAPDAAEAEESSDDSPRSRRGRRWAAASPSRPVWPSLGPNFSQALGPGLGARVVAEEAAGDAGRARRQQQGQQDQHTAGRPAAPKGPVLIVHGVLQSSDNWVLRGKDHDLPFLLADAGYDVWLANVRGCTYSRKHTKFADTDYRFWDYTLHEPGVYDLPAFIEKVLATSGADKLHYIGHSMGTTIFYVLGSERPDLMEKVRLAVHLAPVTYWSRIQSAVAKRAFQAAAVLKRLNMPMLFDNYSSRSNRSVFLADTLCRDGSPVQGLCAEALYSIVGSDKAQMNKTMLPMIFAHFPAGASVGQVAHYYQNYEQGMFHQFDFGTDQNILKYGSAKPPDYNLSRVTAPVAIWYGLNDRLVYHEDVVALSKKLPNLVALNLVDFPKFNHFDFLWAKDSYSLLYSSVMETMGKF